MSSNTIPTNEENQEEEKKLTLSLTFAGQPRQIVSSLTSAATVQELYQEAAQRFSNSGNKNNKKKGNAVLTLSAGVPPLVLAQDSSQSLADAGIRHQDRILVSFLVQKKKAPPAKASSPAAEEDASFPQQKKRTSKRAAAAAATASFGETIRQQQALLDAEKTSTKARVKKPKAVNTTTTPPQTSSASKKRPPRFSATSPGRRLQDGAVVAASKPSKRSRKQQHPHDVDSGVSPEDATAMMLLNTASNTSGNTEQGRLMRAGWKKAVLDAFEQNRSTARLAAVASHQVVFNLVDSADSSTSCSSSSTSRLLVVTYPKGVQGKGEYQDTVDYLPRNVLASVIAQLHPVNPEALRPENLSLLSPRVLWSLLYHSKQQQVYNTTTTSTTTTTDTAATKLEFSVTSALRLIQPQLDWSFLRRRKVQLSAKAIENLRQQEQEQQEDNNWEAAANAILSVEQAMAGDLQGVATTTAADGASSRLPQQSLEDDEYRVVTPDELDEDELRECIRNGIGIGNTTNKSNTEEDDDVESILKALVQVGIHNWRELANVASAEELSSQLQQQLILQQQEEALKNASDSSSITSQIRLLGVTTEIAQAWVDAAQVESLEEIMVEICHGNVAGVELLRTAQSGTPKDLAAWRSISDTLHDVLQEKQKANHQTTINEEEEDDEETENRFALPSREVLRQWCQRAHQALEQLEWLALYATPLLENDEE